jgi:hypothetical protein
MSRAKTAVRNFLEHGRSVTWALAHLKSHASNESDWNEWWAKTTVELRNDRIAQWFYGLRNPIVKEGHPVQIQPNVVLKGPITLPPRDETPPVNATGWMLDGMGTPYWLLADGTRVPSRPLKGIQRSHSLAETPDELADRPLAELMEDYIVECPRFDGHLSVASCLA